MTKNNCVYNDADEFEVPMKQIKDTQFSSGRETKEKRSGEKQGGGQE